MSGDPVSLRETWTDLDGRRLLYRTNAESPPPADAPVLIHVHGFAISGRYLMPAAWRLAPDFRTYVPDLPGFGRSERPPRPFDIPQLADALARFMDKVGVERAQPGPVDQVHQRQRPGEKDDQVVLAALRQRPEHLPDRQDRDRERDDGHEAVDPPAEISPRPFLIIDLGHRSAGRGRWRRRSGLQRRGTRLGRRCPPHRIGRYAGARRYAADCELSKSHGAPQRTLSTTLPLA